MSSIQPGRPQKPTHIPEHAEICLHALAAHGLGHKISLGGAFALLHYLDYRPTHDVDAWWDVGATTADKQQVVAVLREALQSFGEVRLRTFGDVTSIELATDAKKKAFSFQIAQRSAQLQSSGQAGWTDVPLDSFADLLANKMTALVQRGAPRDFRDIYAVCEAGLATSSTCWSLWRQRQELAENESDFARASLAIEGHLERIEQYRPLAKISDDAQRMQAETVRNWYRQEFLYGRMD